LAVVPYQKLIWKILPIRAGFNSNSHAEQVLLLMSNSTDSLVCRFYTKHMQKRKMLTGAEKPKKCTYGTISKIEVNQITTKRREKNDKIYQNRSGNPVPILCRKKKKFRGFFFVEKSEIIWQRCTFSRMACCSMRRARRSSSAAAASSPAMLSTAGIDRSAAHSGILHNSHRKAFYGPFSYSGNILSTNRMDH
jgi:hypothetical protein